MHLALYFHAPGYQRGIAVQLGCQILAKVTFQCYFGSKSPAKTNMLMGSNTIGGYRSKNCTTLFAFWTNLQVHVQPEFLSPSKDCREQYLRTCSLQLVTTTAISEVNGSVRQTPQREETRTSRKM